MRSVLPVRPCLHWAAIPTLLAALVLANERAPAAEPWSLAPAPPWVEAVPRYETTFAGRSERPIDVDHRLFEHQVDLRRAGEPVSWTAIERELVSRRGVRDGSRLKIDFDPAYQTLRLHELEIYRDGRRHERLSSARIDVLHREPDLEVATFDGRRTLSIVLADVRAGDVLRAAWSIEGSNPVFGGHHEAHFSTTSSHVRQARRRLRVLSPGGAPWLVRQSGATVEVGRKIVDSTEETIIDLGPLAPRYASEDEPDGEDGYVVFGTLASWSDVVALERPLYAVAGDPPAELTRLAERIAAGHTDTRGRIGAALRWVQEEIRYFGVQLGEHSHRPAPVSATLARRFADCKGKALLLIALLDALGVEASPALVETDGLLRDPDQPWRLHAFDHVVVALELDGQRHFVDPTLSYQRGALGQFHEPDHAQALVLAEGVAGLEPMGGTRSGWYVDVTNDIELAPDAAGEASLTITTVRRGEAAETMRRQLAEDGARAVEARYRDYYREIWPGTVEREPLEVEETADGALRLVERYDVPRFWGEKAGTVWLTPDTLSSDWLTLPDIDLDRPRLSTPLTYPADVTERWRIALPRPMRLTELGGTIETPWYRVAETWQLDESATVLDVSMRYTGLAPAVSAEQRSDFEAPGERMDALLGFSIEDAWPLPPWLQSTLDTADKMTDPTPLTRLETIDAWAALLGLPCIVGWAGLRHRRNGRRGDTGTARGDSSAGPAHADA